MSKELIKAQMKVKDNLVNVMRVGDIDYISLTDLARYKNSLTPGDVRVIKVLLIFIVYGKNFQILILN